MQKKSPRKREKYMSGLKTEYMGHNMITMKRKEMRKKSKGYKLDGIVLIVKSKNEGRYRFTELNPNVQKSFGEIKKRALNFDQDGCSTFEENEFDCV